MSQPGLYELERRARDLAREHGLESYLLTQFGAVQKLFAYVQQDTHGFHFITPDEDGSEMERRTTQDADDILFWVVSDAASRAALYRFGSHNSDVQSSGGKSCRQAWFERELEILGRISPEWRRRRRTELDKILTAHPEG